MDDSKRHRSPKKTPLKPETFVFSVRLPISILGVYDKKKLSDLMKNAVDKKLASLTKQDLDDE